jgi:hypothetical protein
MLTACDVVCAIAGAVINGLRTVPLKSSEANSGRAQVVRMREEGLFMSFPVSTFKALVSGIGWLRHSRGLRKLPFTNWTNELNCLGHLDEN